MNTKMMIERNETDKWNSRMESATYHLAKMCEWVWVYVADCSRNRFEHIIDMYFTR